MDATRRLVVDLGAPAHERWEALRPHASDARAMIAQYLGDLVRAGAPRDVVLGLSVASEAAAVPERLRAEIDAVASVVGAPRDEVLAANLYYDAFRQLMGCTAFAVDADEGPLHARNLDWWTQDALLSRATIVCEHVGGPVGPFTTIGWPGLVGAFSGVAAGRFAVTMNAVLSEERPSLATSTPMMIRDVLERCASYEDARRALAGTPIASDCLLLLTGVRRGELCVIERTSTRAAIREAEDGVVATTNDYRTLDAVATATTALAITARGRLECASARARSERPRDADGALAILRDPDIRMGITVQHMVLHAATGACTVALPDR